MSDTVKFLSRPMTPSHPKHKHTLSHTHTISFSHTHSHKHNILSHTLTHTLSHTQSLSLSRTHSHKHTRARTLTHIYTYTYTHSLTLRNITGRCGSFRGVSRPRSTSLSTRHRTSSDSAHLNLTSSPALTSQTSLLTSSSPSLRDRPTIHSSLQNISFSSSSFTGSRQDTGHISTSCSLSLSQLETVDIISSEHDFVASLIDSSPQTIDSTIVATNVDVPKKPDGEMPQSCTKSATRSKSKRKRAWKQILKVKSACSLKSNVTLRQKILRRQHSIANASERCPIYSPCTELRKGKYSGIDIPAKRVITNFVVVV